MDLLTQLQDKLDQLFLVFGTCIGVLQRDAPNSAFQNNGDLPPEWLNQTKDMALQVIETSKLIESYIESLPGFNRTEPEQYNNLKLLNSESKQMNDQLQLSKQDALEMLSQVKDAINLIIEDSQDI
eukprot:gene4791-5976_t